MIVMMVVNTMAIAVFNTSLCTISTTRACVGADTCARRRNPNPSLIFISSVVLLLQIRRNVSSSAPGGSSSRAPEFEHEPFLEVCIGAIRCGASVKTESFSHLQVREYRSLCHPQRHHCVSFMRLTYMRLQHCVACMCDCNIVSHACVTAMLCLMHAH
jgi:hypothetical protein